MERPCYPVCLSCVHADGSAVCVDDTGDVTENRKTRLTNASLVLYSLLSAIRSLKFSILERIAFIVRSKSTSLLPVGSSNPQSSLCIQGKKGHCTLQPMVTT